MSDTTDVITAEIPGADPSYFTSLTMAHRLNATDKKRLGLPEDANVKAGATVRVLKEHARTLIAAGYAQVDPEDQAAVDEALARTAANAKSQGEAPDAGEGTDKDAGEGDAAKASEGDSADASEGAEGSAADAPDSSLTEALASAEAPSSPDAPTASGDPVQPVPVEIVKVSARKGRE